MFATNVRDLEVMLKAINGNSFVTTASVSKLKRLQNAVYLVDPDLVPLDLAHEFTVAKHEFDENKPNVVRLKTQPRLRLIAG